MTHSDTQTVGADGQPLNPAPIEARVDALPPGDWPVDWETCDCGDGYACGHGAHAIKIGPLLVETIESPGHAAIAAFIGAARQDVPALLAENRRLRERLAIHETPPSSTDEDYLARLHETFVDVLAHVARRGGGPMRAADAVMVYVKAALWAFERDMAQVVTAAEFVAELSLIGIQAHAHRAAEARTAAEHLRHQQDAANARTTTEPQAGGGGGD